MSEGVLDMSDVIRFATLVESCCSRLIYFQTNMDKLAPGELSTKSIASCLKVVEET